MNKVTIKDVARAAGVSISTVSNALNDVDVLSPQTKEKVLEAAKRLKYIPNLNGKNLKAKRKKTIGLYTESMEGFFYGMLVDAVSKACESLDYELIIHVTFNKTRIIRSILGHNEDGVIILNVDEKREITEMVKEYDIPAVFLQKEECSERVSSIIFDSYGAGRIAAGCLIKSGYRTFGYIHGFANIYDDKERFRGFTEELALNNMCLDKNAELTGKFNDEVTYDAVTKYLRSVEKPVEAFFAANDTSAMGCINAVMDFGLRVPEDVAVIGCDGVEMGKFVKPALTTVSNPISEEGRAAVELLIGLIEKTDMGRMVKLPVKLIVRGTTGEKIRQAVSEGI